MLLIDFATITICICILKFSGGEKDVISFCMLVIYMFIFIQKKDFGIKSKHSTVTSNQIEYIKFINDLV